MEEVKLRTLGNILEFEAENALDIFFEEVFDCLDRARDEYVEKIELSDDQFSEMLVLDGCFIIGLLIGVVPSNDQVKNARFIMLNDLRLFENQIPYFVITKLYSKIPRLRCLMSLLNDDLDFMSLILREFSIQVPSKPREEDVKHILHLYHLSFNPCLVSDELRRQPFGQHAIFIWKKVTGPIYAVFFGLLYLIMFRDLSRIFGSAKTLPTQGRIPCATELEEAGIKFRRKLISEEYERASRLKVSFSNGTLEIPHLYLGDSTCPELRNLMAFEQCCRNISSHFTDYCAFLDHIIDTANDVAILQKCGILESGLGCDSKTAHMFNTLTQGIFWNSENQYLAEVYKEVVKLCEVPHNKWRALLLQNYFKSPWTILSFIGVLCLIIFGATQTFIAIFRRK